MKNFGIAILLLLTSIWSACNGDNDQAKSVKKTDPDSDQYLTKKPSHFHFNYDSSKKEIQNYDLGYTDSFSIEGKHYELRLNPLPHTKDGMEMIQFENGEWQTNFRDNFGTYGIDRSYDMNNDGFPDFQTFYPGYSWLHLYDSANKKFSKETFPISLNFQLIDSNRNIYYEVWEADTAKIIKSDLYQFEGNYQKFLYALTTPVIKSEKGNKRMLRLYQCSHRNLADTVLIKKILVDESKQPFSQQKFWKEFVKKML